jgi:mycofactocin precursor
MGTDATVDMAVTISSTPGSTVVEQANSAGDADVLVEDDLLVEEVSIDGMCGVY